jgi:hypothetical protein
MCTNTSLYLILLMKIDESEGSNHKGDKIDGKNNIRM